MKYVIVCIVVISNLFLSFVAFRGMPAGYTSWPGGAAVNQGVEVASVIAADFKAKMAVVLSRPKIHKNHNESTPTTADRFLKASEARLKRSRPVDQGGAKFIGTSEE